MPTNSLYSLGQVAAVLSAPILRIRNLSVTASYGLTPAAHVGTGRGSRRLFAFRDVLALAVADALYETGWTPQEIGRALAAIRPGDYRSAGSEPESPARVYLIRERGAWSTAEQGDIAHSTLAATAARGPVFAMGLTGHWEAVVQRLTELEADGAMPNRKPKLRNAKGAK